MHMKDFSSLKINSTQTGNYGDRMDLEMVLIYSLKVFCYITVS